MEGKIRKTASNAFILVIGLEFVVCIIMLAIGWWLNRDYFRGVGIGLLIAWVTGALAYLRTRKIEGTEKKA